MLRRRLFGRHGGAAGPRRPPFKEMAPEKGARGTWRVKLIQVVAGLAVEKQLLAPSRAPDTGKAPRQSLPVSSRNYRILQSPVRLHER